MIVRKIKENYFFFLIVMIYGVLTIMDTSMGVMSIKNSGYYIKEMLFIMPVIFILTALLDFWVPKEKIMQLLGKDAKIKGIFFSFIIGSISAGPIYAAFPMCSMLYKKGASIRNIVIILSSWAVIKVPMLLNEGKFLGVQFMGFRWLLTVIAIIIFSWIMDKNIKNEDMPLENIIDNGLRINRGACIGCSLCAKTYHEIFEMKNNKAKVKDYDDAAIDMKKLNKAIEDCPVNAINYYKNN